MTRRPIAVIVAILAGVALVACTGNSPVAPSPAVTESIAASVAPNESHNVSPLAQPVAGSYELGFFTSGPTGPEPVQGPLPVSSVELVLGAHVEDAFGAPAQKGAVTFQYCSYRGLPPNDITRADEAPSAACASGEATWKNLVARIGVDASGNAYLTFGIVQIPRTVGFRFQYYGQGSGIANAVSAPADFTWVPAT